MHAEPGEGGRPASIMAVGGRSSHAKLFQRSGGDVWHRGGHPMPVRWRRAAAFGWGHAEASKEACFLGKTECLGMGVHPSMARGDTSVG